MRARRAWTFEAMTKSTITVLEHTVMLLFGLWSFTQVVALLGAVPGW